MTRWVCSSCGREDVTVSEARPSLDDRFAVGYCPTCAPAPNAYVDTAVKKRRVAQPVVPLVRADLWDPAVITERKRRHDDERFLSKYRDGKIDANDPKNRERAVALLAKYDAERGARSSHV